MLLYKYRPVAPGDVTALTRLDSIVSRGLIWCARLNKLNDAEEFAWTCDYTASDATVGILAEMIRERKGRPRELARRIAQAVVRGNGLERRARPIIEGLIERTRDAIGGSQLHRVVYDDERRLHLDDFLRAPHDLRYAEAVYATLLTKRCCWKPEAEVRFLSQRQAVEVMFWSGRSSERPSIRLRVTAS